MSKTLFDVCVWGGGAVLEIIFIDYNYGQMSFVPGHTDWTHAGMHGHSN